MLRVEYNIKAYNVVCGMIRPGCVLSVLLDASPETSAFPDRWLHTFHLVMINDLSCVSNHNNDSLPLLHSFKKKQNRFPAIDPTFDITIVYPRSALHLDELSKKNQLYFVQKKSLYSLDSFHPKSRTSKKNTTNNNNCFF